MPSWFSPLRWQGPPELERLRIAMAASTSHTIGWVFVVAGFIWLGAASLSSGAPPARLIAGAGTVALGAGVIALVRSGRVRPGNLLAVLGGFAIVSLGALHTGGALAPASTGYFAVVTVAALTLGGRAAIATALASSAFLAILASWPQLDPAPAIGSDTAIVAHCIMLIVIAVVLHLARDRVDWALAQAERHEREFESRNRALESERERFQVISDSSRELITEMDLEGNLRYASPNHGEVLGWTPEEIVGRDWRKVVHPEDMGYADASADVQVRDGEIPATTYRVRHRDGSVRWLESTARTFASADGGERLVSVTRDITQRVALESELRQSQKLEAVGRLAGGVAHDFNNLLTVINGYSEVLLRRDALAGDPALQEIHAAGERAKSLTQQLLAFSRRQSLRPRIIDVDRTVRNVESLLLRLVGEHITLSFRPSPEPLSVFIDPSDLEQVVVNLAVNARDAMPAGGRIDMSTHAEAGQPDQSSGANESWAVLEVRDEGVGMSGEVLSHLFEPFYTTKEVGEGTGLGLATVHGIVEQSGGHVDVESEPGRGTCFRIYLRRVDEKALEEVETTSEESKPDGPRTILLAEDDPAVRRLVGSVLREAGNTVIEAANGLEALSLLLRGEHPIDLLLTDIVMPEMDGRTLRTKLAELRPGIPTVFMSGYPDRGGQEAAEEPLPGDCVISKPFRRAELLSTVRSALQSQAQDD